MEHTTIRLLLTAVLYCVSAASPGQSGFALPLTSSAGGAYELSMSLAGVDDSEASFLLDTGAAMMSINSEFFAVLRSNDAVRELREVGVRLADGRRRLLSVYEVRGLRLSDGCEIDAVEAVLVPGKGRNLLGLNVLQQFAPITLSIDPPALSVSGCDGEFLPVAAAP